MLLILGRLQRYMNLYFYIFYTSMILIIEVIINAGNIEVAGLFY